MTCRSPIDGSAIGQVEETSTEETAAVIERSRRAALEWGLVPAPKRGQLVSAIAEIVRRRKSQLAAIVTREVGKIPIRGRGRSAGMDRHLRFRRGPVPPALRIDHRLRAAESPDDGTMASAGPCRHHHRVQLSHCRLGMECHDRAGLRQQRIWKPSEKGALCGKGGRVRACRGGYSRQDCLKCSRAEQKPECASPNRNTYRWCRRPVRCAWASRLPRPWAKGWAAVFSNSAAITPRSSRHRPT